MVLKNLNKKGEEKMKNIKYVINKGKNTIEMIVNVTGVQGELNKDKILSMLREEIGDESVVFPKFNIYVTGDDYNKTISMSLINSYQLKRFCNIYHSIKKSGSKNRCLYEESSEGRGLFSHVKVNSEGIRMLTVRVSKTKLLNLDVVARPDIVNLVSATLMSEYNKTIPEFIHTIDDCDEDFEISLYFNEEFDKEDLIDLYDLITI